MEVLINYKQEQELWEKENLFMNSKKSYNAKRWKEDNVDLYRTDYQRDVGRILYSEPFRRLRMKTQVFTASGLDQHNRTRLTHSLEVSQIAKSIARPLRLNTDLVEAIALGHDLGHTPFGHAGERALNKCLEEMGGFSHNVQSVRIVRSYIFFRKDKNNVKYRGLNLTYDVVEGIWKHTDYKDTLNQYDDLKYFKPEEDSSLEGQVVDIADGLAYVMHDAEDSIRQKIIKTLDIEKVWNENIDVKFDRQNWFNIFIHDIIRNSYEANKVSFSPDIKKLYKAIKKYIKDNVLLSNKIKSIDAECVEKISTIFDYYLKNPEEVINKIPKMNIYTFNTEGIERVIANYIQWLGDEIANSIYNKIINNNQTIFY